MRRALLPFVVTAALLHVVSRRLVLRRDWGMPSPDAEPQFEPADYAKIEQENTLRWNHSDSDFLVLGQKAGRDFGVYVWAFGKQNFRLTTASQGFVSFDARKSLKEPPLPGVGALLCHSLFLSNCVRPLQGRATPGSVAGIFDRIKGMKINRIAGARQVLSTKDGLCHTLYLSGLATSALGAFSFPCWVLPANVAGLTRHLQAAETASQRFIVKPARGSQGQGIRVFNGSALQLAVQQHQHLAALKVPVVVQPYLRQPLLHHGRKWDVRTYVLATSVLPMRLYVFSEAIVRYAASASYSPDSTDQSSVLTNTFVGKRILQRGVGSITGSLASLCDASDDVHKCSSLLMDAMRDAIGRLFLSAEPRLRQVYRDSYGKGKEAGGGADEGEKLGPNDASRATPFRCSECYHLFGVDLIADSDQQMHVIEVNIAPDLTLSTQGVACQHGATNCSDGSTKYDHTKLGAAYNTVRLVYSKRSVASQLQDFVRRHADQIAQLDLLLLPSTSHGAYASTADNPSTASAANAPHVPSAPILQRDVAEYMLDMIRERGEAGCFAPVYPSTRHHSEHRTHLELMASGMNPCPTNDTTCEDRASRSTRLYMRRRLQMHTLLGILLEDLDAPTFRQRCEGMLAEVSMQQPNDRQNAWAKREHIFKTVASLVS